MGEGLLPEAPLLGQGEAFAGTGLLPGPGAGLLRSATTSRLPRLLPPPGASEHGWGSLYTPHPLRRQGWHVVVGPARSAMMVGGERALQVRAKQSPLGRGDEDLIWSWDRKRADGQVWCRLTGTMGCRRPSSGVPSTLCPSALGRPHGRREKVLEVHGTGCVKAPRQMP